MDIAVIKSGNKQYKVKVGDKIQAEKIEGNVGQEVKFKTILLADEKTGEAKIGKPELSETVIGEIAEQYRDRKINIIKFKSKVRYRRNVGHRQHFTDIKITKI